MQRQVHQSLRSLCRQHCRRRLYSVQAATTQIITPDTQHEPVASTSSSSVHVNNKGEHSPPNSLTSNEADPLNDPTPQQQLKALQKSPKNSKQQQLYSQPEGYKHKSRTSKVDSYLASLRAGGIEPTIEDLAALKPRGNPPKKSDIESYSHSYTTHFERLCRTFSKAQLQRFCQELQLGHQWSRPGRTKFGYAEAIMEKEWGWEHMRELKKREQDKIEVSTKTFPVSASELFLLLGKDGSELLQISTDYNVHISVTPNPLCIRIEGFKPKIKKLEAMIVERRKSIIEETIKLPTNEPLSVTLLQKVSRTANAFIENVGSDGQIRICSNSQQRLTIAKRLATRAAMNTNWTRVTPFIALLPAPPRIISPMENTSSYALFPFLPHGALPWTSESKSTFRSRKIGDWLGGGSETPTSFSPIGTDKRGMLLNINGELSTLEDIVNQSFKGDTSSCTLKASTGHILITADSEKSRPSILPPLAGRWQYSELMDWMKDGTARRIFVPCLPPPIHSAPPAREEIVHRLIYRLVSSNDGLLDDRGSGFRPSPVFHAEVIINRQILEEDNQPELEPEILPDMGRNIEDIRINAELDELIIDDSAQSPDLAESSNDPYPTSEEGQVSDGLDSICSDSSSGTSDVDVSVSGQTGTVENTEPGEAFSEKESTTDDEIISESVNADVVTPDEKFGSKPTCRRGRELELLIALPDRPMDLKLTILGSVDTVPIDSIPELSKYFETLKRYLEGESASEPSPPEPPLFIQDGGNKYLLELNASIRRSTDSIDLGRGMVQELDSTNIYDLAERRVIPTATESSYDLESGQRMVNCEMSCENAPSGDAWISFLQDIDSVTSLGYKRDLPGSPRKRFSLDPSNKDAQLN